MKKPGIISVEDSPVASSQEQSIPPYRILVFDDDNDVRQFSVDRLVDSDNEVELVKNGAAGWEALRINRVDLVVTGNIIPPMSGI